MSTEYNVDYQCKLLPNIYGNIYLYISGVCLYFRFASTWETLVKCS